MIDQTEPADVVVRGDARSFRQEIVSDKHRLGADEPVNAGGGDTGPDPYDYLLVSLGTCTSMTVGLYARRKQMPLENIMGGVCAPQRARGQPTTAFLAGNARANASPRETIIGKVTPLVPAKRNWLPKGKK